MKKLLLLLPLFAACSKEVQSVPVSTTINNVTTTVIEYTCVDVKPFPLGVIKIKCHSKAHCLQVCK